MGNTININWTLFLGRAAAELDRGVVEEFLRGKRVLITGAGGSIGSALARRVASEGVERLVAMDIAEHGLFELGAAFDDGPGNANAVLVVGDVCDPALLLELFTEHRPDVVFHAAACKHVSLMETNPFAAARNNIIGTQRLLTAARAAGAGQVVVLSTDKAVDPAGIMGATKRVAELLVLASRGPTKVNAVRLANVLGSSGSVVPTFMRQMARGGPLTITDPACMRYFLSMEDAVRHLLAALAVDVSSAVLVPETGRAFSVEELARFLVGTGKAETVCTGLRAGEKLVERMSADGETLRPSNVPLLQGAIQDGAVSDAMLASAIEEIERAVERRDLHRLFDAIIALVPGYAPSGQMAERAV